MKKINMSVVVTLLLGAVTASAQQPTITSFATVNTAANEALLPSLDSQYEVPDTNVTGVNSVSFATRIDFPTGTTSAQITNVSFTVDRIINGVPTTQFSNVSMNGSTWNNEGGTSSPNLFVRDPQGSLISMTGTLTGGGAIPNPSKFFLTRQTIPLGGTFPKLVKEGDMWKISRSINISWTVSGVPNSTTLQTESVVVVWFYPTNPPTVTSVSVDGGETNITLSGVTTGSYGDTWWMETSTDLGIIDPWITATNGSVSGSTVISFPVDSDEDRRFWRVKYTPNPGP